MLTIMFLCVSAIEAVQHRVIARAQPELKPCSIAIEAVQHRMIARAQAEHCTVY